VCFATPPSTNSSQFDASDSATAPHRFRLITDLLGTPPEPSQLAQRPQLEEERANDDEGLHLAVGEDPSTFADAERKDHWRRAMLDELHSIDENGTWTLTSLPAGQAIGLK
jgi:hypothetical protein